MRQATLSLTKKEVDEISYKVIGAAIEVHKILGPGLLESVYHKCMIKELQERNMVYASEVVVEVDYKGLEMETQLKCDLLVERCIAVELKSVDAIAPVFESQILTYMRLLNVPKGLLINFNCVNIFKEGQKTFVNDLYRKLSVN